MASASLLINLSNSGTAVGYSHQPVFPLQHLVRANTVGSGDPIYAKHWANRYWNEASRRTIAPNPDW